MTHCDISKVKRAIRYITHCQEYKERDVFKLHFQYPCQVNIEGGAGMRGDAQGWSREISYTGLIRKEVCSDCIKSTSPNITQTLSTPAKLFQSGLSCLKLSVTSSVKVGLAIFRRVCDSVEGKGGRKKKSCPLSFTGWVFSHYSKKHQFVPPTSHSTEMASWSSSQSTKSTKCQGKSSKVCWRAAGADKNTDECRRTVYLTWVAMQEKMTSPVY